MTSPSVGRPRCSSTRGAYSAITTAFDARLNWNFEPTTAECKAVTRAMRLDERIELLITDIQMPGMDGAELVERAKEMRPTLQVIVTSGRRDAPTGVPLIRKPFGIADLVEAMKRHTGLC